MKQVLIAALLTSLFSISGCARDYSLAPPPDSEYVTVTVKVPDELIAEPMQVVYRSTRCASMRYTAIGTSYKRDRVQRMEIKPVRIGHSDKYEAKLKIDGGGACRWRLSNVTFGVVYGNPASFGENVAVGSSGGIIVIFDNHDSPRGPATFKVDGDLNITRDYYPWIKESFIGGYIKRVSLAGEGYIYAMYKAPQARQVSFVPVLHSKFALYSAEPKVKKDGDYTSFTYPDGSVSADNRWHPNFLRLQTIRLKAEGKQ